MADQFKTDVIKATTARTAQVTSTRTTLGMGTAPSTGAYFLKTQAVSRGAVDTNVTSYREAVAPNFNVVQQPYAGPVYPNYGSKPYDEPMVNEKDITPSAKPVEIDNSKFGYKVRLIAVRNFPQEYVIFRASPILTESRDVEYASVSPVHMPGSIQVYKKTNARAFMLSASLVSRNAEQATENLKILQLLRGWTMPYFGVRSATDEFTNVDGTTGQGDNTDTTTLQMIKSGNHGVLGAPPDVLYLYAYSDSLNADADRAEGQSNIKKIPVVITTLGLDYPDDVDYIISSSGEPFPVKMKVSLNMLETHSPASYEKFSLSMFKTGQLVQF